MIAVRDWLAILSYSDEKQINCGYWVRITYPGSERIFTQDAKSVKLYKAFHGLIWLAVSICISTNDVDSFWTQSPTPEIRAFLDTNSCRLGWVPSIKWDPRLNAGTYRVDPIGPETDIWNSHINTSTICTDPSKSDNRYLDTWYLPLHMIKVPTPRG